MSQDYKELAKSAVDLMSKTMDAVFASAATTVDTVIQMANDATAEKTAAVAGQKPTITQETFESLDVRMCRVVEVTNVLKNPKKEVSETNPVKAYRLLIDTGVDQRECLTNAVSLPKESFIGAILPFVLNLPERDIRGVKSRAMLLAVSGASGPLLLNSSGAAAGAVVI